MKTKRFPGFTLVELILVLMLTVLITASSYVLLAFANTASESFSTEQSDFLEFSAFARVFEQDLFKCEIISTEDSNRLLLQSQGETILYQFTPEGIFKKSPGPSDQIYKFDLVADAYCKELKFDQRLRQSNGNIEIQFQRPKSAKLFFRKD